MGYFGADNFGLSADCSGPARMRSVSSGWPSTRGRHHCVDCAPSWRQTFCHLSLATATFNHSYSPHSDRLAERSRMGDTHVAGSDVCALMRLSITKMFASRKFVLSSILLVAMATTHFSLRGSSHVSQSRRASECENKGENELLGHPVRINIVSINQYQYCCADLDPPMPAI